MSLSLHFPSPTFLLESDLPFIRNLEESSVDCRVTSFPPAFYYYSVL